MKLLGCIVIALLISGCQTWPSTPQSAPVPPSHSKYQFDYKVTNGEPIGLVRAFDDGGSTCFAGAAGHGIAPTGASSSKCAT